MPLTVIRRFDCILAATKAAVLKKNEKVGKLATKDTFLSREAGYSFYNTSPFDFEKLLNDPDGIEANFRSYLNGFSENVRNIIEKFKFDNHIATLAEKNCCILSFRSLPRLMPIYIPIKYPT
ncbi:type I restriction-modification system subunit M N-terminal domain-containing protein [Acetobacterium bakii]|uniref:type I restriction-modification system subunit M N-terminal domain-containing protein n=1 Tax=Acetobacterium bakii TaxID=52689 RepID=UPI0019625E05|nr:type I restriction-modification system subunit M N-terminal domain-containing protein [Acetobacterium bakii]